MFENTGRTEISALGEFGLIAHLTKNISLTNATTLKGVGDDAAIINHEGNQTVLSTDLLLEGVHFDLTYVPLRHLGYKSVIVNLSDVYAMNAHPKQILVSNIKSIVIVMQFCCYLLKSADLVHYCWRH